MSRPRVLVTGGTGFLGKQVVPRLREKFDVEVLSRSGKTELRGNLSQWNAGLDFESLRRKRYDLFLHLAGLYDLKASKVECHQHNIAAMGTALKVAEALGISRFINASTVAAAINSNLPSVIPYDLNLSKNFPDAYSESKALGEQILMNWPVSRIQSRINLRLGILVGDSKNGKIERIDGPYQAAEAFGKLKSLIKVLPTKLVLPGNSHSNLPLVPVDVAASAIVSFCEWSLTDKDHGYLSFHLTPRSGLPVKELYLSVLKNLAIPHKGVYLLDKVSDVLSIKASKYLAKFPEEELYYLLNFPTYDSEKTIQVLGENWCPEFKSYESIFWSGYEKFISNRGD